MIRGFLCLPGTLLTMSFEHFGLGVCLFIFYEKRLTSGLKFPSKFERVVYSNPQPAPVDSCL
ncbi:hypothetical protein EMIT0194MI4_40123 [Pseudomonas sp. IT-194MI4]